MVLYGLFEVDDENVELRYIGITKKRVDERLRSHWKNVDAGEKTYKASWMRRTLERGTAVVPLELMVVPDVRWEEVERAFIATLSDAGYRLTNTHPGGGGGDVVRDRGTWNPSDAWTEARRRSRGTKRTDETKELIADRIKDAYREGRCRRSRESYSEASKRSWETRKARIASGELLPPKGPNAGKKLPPEFGASVSAGKLKGQPSQQELVQLVAEHAGVHYNQAYRSLKRNRYTPKSAVLVAVWKSYDALGARVAALKVDTSRRPYGRSVELSPSGS